MSGLIGDALTSFGFHIRGTQVVERCTTAYKSAASEPKWVQTPAPPSYSIINNRDGYCTISSTMAMSATTPLFEGFVDTTMDALRLIEVCL